MMAKAIFFDRDGTLNRPVLDPKTGEYGAPHNPEKIELVPNAVELLKKVQDSYKLFLVSNQPDVAKGKATLDALHKVHAEFERLMTSNGIHFEEFFYCYHHPNGTNPEYSYTCECRKPKPLFLLEAAEKYGIDLSESWMIGDRDVDVDCGKAAGTKTILIKEALSATHHGKSKPNFEANNLKEAIDLVLSKK